MGENLVSKVVIGAVATAALVYLLKTQYDKDLEKDTRKKKGEKGRESPQLGKLDAVGGHGSKKNKGPPILVRGNMILKPFQGSQGEGKKSRGELEAEYYEMVTKSNNPIKPFIPAYYGKEVIDGTSYLKMENLLAGLKEPCMLDLKMGQQTYDEDATPAKIERERKKYPPQEIIGFRIVGMKVHRAATKEVFKSTRDWCMSVDENTMGNAIEQFFFDGRVVRHNLVQQLIEKLDEISKMLKNHPQWRMYGSSLLVVYDGANPTKVFVKMIDFAHIFEIKDGGVDDGYLHGLSFLKHCLELTLRESGGTQVGGAHGNIASSGGELTKSEDKKDQFDTEVEFYKKAWDSSTPDSMSSVMPKFIRVNEDVSPRQLVISDATLLVKRLPSDPIAIMDIKLGVRSFTHSCPNEPHPSYFSKYAAFEQELAPGRTDEIWEQLVGNKNGPESLKRGELGKRDYLSFRDATTTSLDLGFRLTALVHGDYKITQNESRSIETRIRFLDILEHFLSTEDGFDSGLANQFTEKLSQVHSAAQDSKMFQDYEMVGTSLLFLHCNGRAAIKWIDFANSKPAPKSNRENGIIQGIECLALAINELVTKHAQEL